MQFKVRNPQKMIAFDFLNGGKGGARERGRNDPNIVCTYE
jgi:hypothetical protein